MPHPLSVPTRCAHIVTHTAAALKRPQTCFESCGDGIDAVLLLFVVSDGDKCACGFDLTYVESTPDMMADTCDRPCTGDDSLTCGGDDAYELYQLLDDVLVGTTPSPALAPSPSLPPTPAAPVAEPTTPVSAPSVDDGELGSMFRSSSVLRVRNGRNTKKNTWTAGSATAPGNTRCVGGRNSFRRWFVTTLPVQIEALPGCLACLSVLTFIKLCTEKARAPSLSEVQLWLGCIRSLSPPR